MIATVEGRGRVLPPLAPAAAVTARRPRCRPGRVQPRPGWADRPSRPHRHHPAPRDVWREVLAADPDAVVTQSPEWTDALATRGYTDASRLSSSPTAAA